MSENLRILGKYSAAMEAGDTDAVFEFWADDFVSHVTERVSPERVGSDIRGEEQHWWQQARAAFPDMTFAVNLLIESGDLVVSNWTVKGTHTGAAFYDVPPSGDPLEINGTAILRLRERPDRRAVGWTALPAWAGIDPLNHDSERSRTYRSRAAMFRTARSRCGRPRSPSWP